MDNEFNRDIFKAAYVRGLKYTENGLYDTGVADEAWFFLNTMNEEERNDYIYGR